MTAQRVRKAVGALERGAWAEAERICAEVLQHSPNEPQALLVLGTVRAYCGDTMSAERLFERARAAAPRDIVVLNSLGGAYGANGRINEARAVLNEALSIDPNFPWAHQNIAGLLLDAGDWAGAKRHYERALKGKPGYADAIAGLADLAEKEHRLDEADAQARKALQLAPQLATARLVLARLALRRRDYRGVIAELEGCVAREQWRASHRAMASSLLGHAHEGLGEFDKAFAAFNFANDLQRATYAPRFATDTGVMSLGVVRRLTEFVRSADVQSWSAGPPSERPDSVFLIGFPRSGTTLAEQILASHPDVETLEEQDGFIDAFDPLILIEGGLSRWKDLSAEEIAGFRAAYWRRTEATLRRAPRRPVVLDKLPLNTIVLPLIYRLFPRAKILFARRDPRDVAISCFQQNFAVNPAMFHFLSLETTVRYYDAVMELALASRARLPLALRELRYEALVADFDRTVAATLEFLGLPWNDAVTRYAETARERAVRTPSAAGVVEPIYASAIGRWRGYGVQLRPHLPVLERWVKAYGYERA